MYKPDSDASMLTCAQCGIAKDKSDFRRRFPGRENRIHQCRSCHAESERTRRRAKRSQAHRQDVNHELARLKRAKSASQVALVCATMIRAFGGADAFTRTWTHCLHRDLARGGFAALRHLEAVIRLVQHCEAQSPDYSRMTDEELHEAAFRLSE
jgi:hypothetical protein